MATENEIPVGKPRICMIQVNRENYYVESVSDYYKVSLTIPFLDKLIESMDDRFTPKNIAIYSGFHILPGVMLKGMQWRQQFKHFLKHYLRTITNLDNIDAELDLWETFWQKEMKLNPSSVTKFVRVGDVLKACEEFDIKITFPFIYQCLKILGTVPVTTCECERSISVIRRLKTYLRSTMTQERFSSLALLHIRREFDHDLDKIIDIFALKKHRRKKFIDILDDNEENED